jgi:hypothetical protein
MTGRTTCTYICRSCAFAISVVASVTSPSIATAMQSQWASWKELGFWIDSDNVVF